MKIETSTVKRLCKENGTNLKKIAYKLGVPYNTIYAATKRGSCSKEVAEAIASAFDVDVSYICGEPANKKLGDTLLMYRKEKGFTQERLAAEINTTKATISRYEKGERTPDIYIFAKLCAVLGISMDDVLNEKDEIELSPCPFCGGEPLIVNSVNHFSIRCRNSCCEQVYLYENKDDAIEDWNRREYGDCTKN